MSTRGFRESVVLLPNPPRLDGEAMRAALARPTCVCPVPLCICPAGIYDHIEGALEHATGVHAFRLRERHDWRRVLASLTSEGSE